MEPMPMSEAYRGLLHEITYRGTDETNARTGVKIRMAGGGHSFKVDLSGKRLPVPGNRRYFPRVAAAEVAWQLMGTREPDFILKHAPKLWEKFVEDGELATAYGYRWRKHFGRDQLGMAVQQLRDNPTNRQLYISAWDPSSDGLGAPHQPMNIPCPVGFSLTRMPPMSFNARRGAGTDEIHMSLFIRSSDVICGLPYDTMCYALTLDAVAKSVGCLPGTLHVTLAHPHIYEPHFGIVYDCIAAVGKHVEWTDGVQPQLPDWSIEEIEADPDTYVSLVAHLSKQVARPDWNPLPELVV